MSDIGVQLRTYFEATAIPVAFEEVRPPPVRAYRPPEPPRRRGPLVAAAAFVVALLLIGGAVLVWRAVSTEDEVVEEVTTTLPPPTTAPPSPTTSAPTPTTMPPGPDEPAGLAPGEVASVATEGQTGFYPAIALADGLPVLVYYDAHAKALGLARCSDAQCAAAKIARVAEVAGVPGHGSVPRATGLAVGPDGSPILVYLAASPEPNADVVLVSCDDPACGASHAVTLGAGHGPSLALDPDGLPVVVYTVEDQGSEFRLVRCQDAACASRTEEVIGSVPFDGPFMDAAVAVGSDGLARVATSGAEGQARLILCEDAGCSSRRDVPLAVHAQVPAIALDGNDVPVVTYSGEPIGPAVNHVAEQHESEALVLTRCTDPSCGELVNAVVDRSDFFAGVPTVVLDPDGSPIIAHARGARATVTRCGDPDCATVATTRPGRFATNVAMALDAGVPVLAFYDLADGDLNVLRCIDGACTAPASAPNPFEDGFDPALWSVRAVGEGPALTEARPRAVIDPGGLPVITFTGSRGAPVHELAPEIVRCGDPACLSATATPVDGGFGHAVAVRADGSPVLSYVSWDDADFYGLKIAVCTDAECSTPDLAEVPGIPEFTGGMALRADGRPVSVHRDYDTEQIDVVMASCLDERCEGLAVDTIPGMGPGFGAPDVVLPADGLPLVVAPADAGVIAVKCSDPECDSSIRTVLVETPVEDPVVAASLTLAPDGLPVVGYYYRGALHVVSCSEPDCSASTDITVADASFIVNQPSIDFLPDGSLLAAYWGADRALHLARCANLQCASPSILPLGDTVGNFTMVVPPDGLPFVAYYGLAAETGEVTLKAAKCLDARCMPS